MQRIGNFLNKECIHNDKNVMEISGFSNHQAEITLDMLFINNKIVQVFKPNHPIGERGIGEVSIIPQITAV